MLTHFPNESAAKVERGSWVDCTNSASGYGFSARPFLYKYLCLASMRRSECLCVCCVYKLIICEESRPRRSPSALPTTNRPTANLLFDSGEVLLGLLVGRDPRRKHVPETHNRLVINIKESPGGAIHLP